MTKYGVSAPCKDCPNRAPCCHSSCAAYGAYRKQIDHYNDIVHKANEARDYSIEQALNARARQTKRRRRYGNGDSE